MFNQLKTKHLLFIIFLVAALLRLWSLGSADMIDDEIYYTFRSIGFLDYVGVNEQTTPLYWFDPLPAWAHLSFHDHPPLVFLIQHLFFSLFGVSVFVARLPFVLAGLGSVFLIYLIAKKLFDQRTGLVAASLMAVTPLAVWTSRVALMEGIVIACLLLAWYLFLKALEEPRYWYWWGAAVGLSFLAKYTAFPLLFVFILYLALYQRRTFRDYRFYLGLLLTLVVFSPVLIYNMLLFQRTGHFDLQFAALLGQQVPEWQTLIFKTGGTWFDTLREIGPGLLNAFSPVLLTLLLVSAVFAIQQTIRKKSSAFVLPLLSLIVYLGFLLVIKPLPRFVAMLTPFAVVLAAATLVAAWQHAEGLKRKLVGGSVVAVLVYELFITINTHLTVISYGLPNLAFSMVRPFSADFGINALDRYLTAEFRNTMSVATPQTGVGNIDRYIQERAKRRRVTAGSSAPTLLVYDPRLHEVATLWLFDRRFIYDGVPTAYADDFTKIIAERGNQYFSGYNIYFISVTPETLWRREIITDTKAISLEQSLQQQGLAPEVITNRLGVPMFRVFKFSL